MNLTDEELYVAMLAITIAMETWNHGQGNRTLPPATAASILATYGTINTHTSIGADLVTKVENWMRDGRAQHVQRSISARLRDVDGGSRLVGLDGRPFLREV